MSPIRLKKLWKGDVSALVERLAQAARAPIVVLDEREAVLLATENAVADALPKFPITLEEEVLGWTMPAPKPLAWLPICALL